MSRILNLTVTIELDDDTDSDDLISELDLTIMYKGAEVDQNITDAEIEDVE